MAKSHPRSHSRYTRQALQLLGALLRAGRLSLRISTQELAERAGISRDMLYRIEKGDPRCEIGVVFELAAIVGVPLFESDLEGLQARNTELAAKLALLPNAIHKRDEEVKDDF